MLSEKIVELQQKINSLGTSYPLKEVRNDFVYKVDLESPTDPCFKKTLDDMNNLITKLLTSISNYQSIDEFKNHDYEWMNELKNHYSEAYIYSKLKSLLVIQKVQEEGQKTPDFKINFRGLPIYIEMKSLSIADGIIKAKEIMEGASDMKRRLEEQLEIGTHYAMEWQIIEPYRKADKSYNRKSIKTVIETIIIKIKQNLKQEQFSLGDTLLLVDMSNQLPVPHPEMAINKFYEINDNKISGILWHIAFGRKNSKIYNFPDTEDDYETEVLEIEGVLNSYPYIKALIFHIDDQFYALAKMTDENLHTIELIRYLCPKNYNVINSIEN